MKRNHDLKPIMFRPVTNSARFVFERLTNTNAPVVSGFWLDVRLSFDHSLAPIPCISASTPAALAYMHPLALIIEL